MQAIQITRARIGFVSKAAAMTLTVLAPFIFIVAMDGWVDYLSNSGLSWQPERVRAIASNAVDTDSLPLTGWTDVALPNAFSGTGTVPTSIWYRLEINSAAPSDALWAVYFSRPNANFSVFVNGRFVGDGGQLTPPLPLHVAPLLFRFPGTLLHAGTNYVDVRSVRETTWSVLQSVKIGPDNVLTPIYQADVFFTTSVMKVTIVCLLMIGAMMAVLFKLRRRDSALGWFAIALFFWAAHISLPLIPRLPFGDPYMRLALSELAFGAFIICAACFTHRFIGLDHFKREKLFAVWFAFGAVVLICDPLFLNHRLDGFFTWVWFPPLGLAGAYPAWQLWSAHRKNNVAGAGILAAVSWFLIVVGSRDRYVEIGWIAWRPEYHPYTAGLVLSAFGVILLRRFVSAVDSAEHARDDLELRIAEKSIALERNLVRIKDMEREQALSAERERIMSDMHEGVGGRLVQALSLATDRPELRSLEEPLRTCLEELRLIIDSIEPTNGDLANVLGTLRTRMSRRLSAAGVQVLWQVEDIPMLIDFGPHRVLQVTRIVQEAIANALKHAQAKRITVRARAMSETHSGGKVPIIVLEITDDGIGIAAKANAGHGLCNMRRRAEDLAARLAIDTSSSGTTVRISLPLATDNGAVENGAVSTA